MKNKEDRLQILLDTSFLLPSLGIDVGQQVYESLKELNENDTEIFYSRFNILESVWVVIRLIKEGKFDSSRFNLGLKSIIDGDRYKPVEEDSSIFTKVVQFYQLGHQDIIDNILYASSLTHNLKFLTLDTKLKRFIEQTGLRDTLIIP